jgi:hypothetical protein
VKKTARPIAAKQAQKRKRRKIAANLLMPKHLPKDAAPAIKKRTADVADTPNRMLLHLPKRTLHLPKSNLVFILVWTPSFTGRGFLLPYHTKSAFRLPEKFHLRNRYAGLV